MILPRNLKHGFLAVRIFDYYDFEDQKVLEKVSIPLRFEVFVIFLAVNEMGHSTFGGQNVVLILDCSPIYFG